MGVAPGRNVRIYRNPLIPRQLSTRPNPGKLHKPGRSRVGFFHVPLLKLFPNQVSGGSFIHNSGALRRDGAKSLLDFGDVIASEAKQSMVQRKGRMDCFAEPVIGRAFARPVGSQ